MTRLAELEAQVQAAWTRGTQVAFGADPQFSRDELRALLAVYADELQQLGDPRGELVALDLQASKDETRAELVAAWLGPFARHPNVNTKYGLVGVSITDSEPQLLAEVLASPAGRYLSSVSIFGDAFTARGALATLARDVRPWLGALRVIVTSSPGVGYALTSDFVAELVEATPALYSLSLGGRSLVREVVHPSVRRLVVEGHDTLAALAGEGEPFASVIELDFAFQLSGHHAEVEDVTRLLPASHLPALQRLDLSRNEPGYHATHNLGGTVSVYRFFRSLALAKQLTYVALPSLRSHQDRDLLQATLDGMPALERLHVAKVYGRGVQLRHPTAKLVIPRATPWPAPGNLANVTITGLAREYRADLGHLVWVMEDCYNTLPVEARRLWDEWWALVETFETTHTTFEFSAGSLADALSACAAVENETDWRTLQAALDENRAAIISVNRF